MTRRLHFEHRWPAAREAERSARGAKSWGLRQIAGMRAQIARFVGPSIAFLLFGVICITGLRAQQAGKNSRISGATTNWVGFLVVGQRDMADQITPTASPTVNRQVEIGLRGDGVIVWRDVTRVK
jgi:hypothetical protein